MTRITHSTPELGSDAVTRIAWLSGARKQVTDPAGQITTKNGVGFAYTCLKPV